MNENHNEPLKSMKLVTLYAPLRPVETMNLKKKIVKTNRTCKNYSSAMEAIGNYENCGTHKNS